MTLAKNRKQVLHLGAQPKNFGHLSDIKIECPLLRGGHSSVDFAQVNSMVYGRYNEH